MNRSLISFRLIVYKICNSMENRPKILVTHYDVPSVAIELMKKKCDLIINDEKPYPNEAQIIKKVKDVDAIFWISKDYNYLGEQIIDAAGPRLKVVGSMSAGVNSIDQELLKSYGIKLSNTPGVINDSTSNTAILLALAASRRVIEGRSAIEKGTWEFGPQWLLGHDITGSKIGIVGYGGIGSAIATRLNAFNVDSILYTGHKEKEQAKKLGAKFVDLDTLLKESDFVFAAVPLTNQTMAMFNKEAFQKMKSTSVFINVSRGGVVVQEDLIEALKNKTIFAAGLDVMTPEPLPTNHELLSLPNCFLTPHIGTATQKTRDDMAKLCAQNILLALEGEKMITPVF